jgi:hypothetical protein
MRISLLYFICCAFALADQCAAESRYRVYLVTEKFDGQMVIRIGDEYQKALDEYPYDDQYLYDFGVFDISNVYDIDLIAVIYYPEQRRVRLAPLYGGRPNCRISECQDFKFEETDAPPTSTKEPDDLCKLHVTSCGRGPIIR